MSQARGHSCIRSSYSPSTLQVLLLSAIWAASQLCSLVRPSAGGQLPDSFLLFFCILLDHEAHLSCSPAFSMSLIALLCPAFRFCFPGQQLLESSQI